METEGETTERLAQFERLVRPLEREMLRAVWRVCRDPRDSEDALQNALLRIWTKLESICAHPAPKLLLLKICIDEAWSHRRRKKRLFSSVEQDIGSIADRTDASETIVCHREELALVFAAMEQLSEQQSLCLWLRCVEQYTYEQIAVAAECREATARKHVERARESLRKLMSYGATRNNSGE